MISVSSFLAAEAQQQQQQQQQHKPQRSTTKKKSSRPESAAAPAAPAVAGLAGLSREDVVESIKLALQDGKALLCGGGATLYRIDSAITDHALFSEFVGDCSSPAVLLCGAAVETGDGGQTDGTTSVACMRVGVAATRERVVVGARWTEASTGEAVRTREAMRSRHWRKTPLDPCVGRRILSLLQCDSAAGETGGDARATATTDENSHGHDNGVASVSALPAALWVYVEGERVLGLDASATHSVAVVASSTDLPVFAEHDVRMAAAALGSADKVRQVPALRALTQHFADHLARHCHSDEPMLEHVRCQVHAIYDILASSVVTIDAVWDDGGVHETLLSAPTASATLSVCVRPALAHDDTGASALPTSHALATQLRWLDMLVERSTSQDISDSMTAFPFTLSRPLDSTSDDTSAFLSGLHTDSGFLVDSTTTATTITTATGDDISSATTDTIKSTGVGSNAGAELPPRADLDFTERLWNLCGRAQSSAHMVEMLTGVFAALGEGRVQPMVHKTNRTALAELVRQSLAVSSPAERLDVQRALAHWLSTPQLALELMANVGAAKLRRDCTHWLLGSDSGSLATYAQVAPYLDADTPLATQLRSLRALQHAIDTLCVAQTYAHAPRDSLRLLVGAALTSPAASELTLAVSSFSTDAAVFRRLCKTTQPLHWTATLWSPLSPLRHAYSYSQTPLFADRDSAAFDGEVDLGEADPLFETVATWNSLF